jgi:DNA-binding FrmR family transcriptional regulator
MHAQKDGTLRGLSEIEQRVSELRRVVEEDVYCVEILRQAYDIRKAIEDLEDRILQGHLQGCVPEGIKEGKLEAVQQELLQLYSMVGNR